MSKRIASFAALALALVAISLLVFQPICEAGELRLPDARAASQAAAADGGEGEPCCSIGGTAPLQAATAVAEPGCPIPEAVGLRASTPEALVSGTVASAAPLPVPRYHARSARIQR